MGQAGLAVWFAGLRRSGAAKTAGSAPLMAAVRRRFPRAPEGAHEAMAALDEDAVNVALIVELCVWYVVCNVPAPRNMVLCDQSYNGGVARAAGPFSVGSTV